MMPILNRQTCKNLVARVWTLGLLMLLAQVGAWAQSGSEKFDHVKPDSRFRVCTGVCAASLAT